MKPKVLVIEDDREIVNLLEIHLKDLSCEVIKAHDGREGLEKATSLKPDLIVLDITLPYMDGIEVCQKIRAVQSTPIIMLTAKVSEENRLKGFDLGADDYICKPFSPREVIARIKSVIRRTNNGANSGTNKRNDNQPTNGLAPDNTQFVSEFEICEASRTASFKHHKLDLTCSEFNLLASLVKSPNRVFERSQLLDLLKKQKAFLHIL